MFYGEEDSDFQNLPPEMVAEVLSLADLKGKQSSRLVCRRWRWILDHPCSGLVCFKTTYAEMTEDSIQCLLKSQLHIDHLVLSYVTVTWPSMTYSRNKFPSIRELTVESENSHQTLMTILQYGCAQAESLTLEKFCFNDVRLDVLSHILSGMRWNYLTELRIEVISNPSDGGGFPSVNGLKKSRKNNVEGIALIFKKARIPNLRVLTFELHSVGDDELSAGIKTLMSNFAIFLEHHSRTLKELRLQLLLVFAHTDSREVLIFPTLPAPLFSAEQPESVARDLKLECLDISSTYFDALVHLVPPCVWESDNLTKLIWSPIWDSWLNLNSIPGTPPVTATPIQPLIQRNRNTLTNVTTTCNHGDIDVDPFQIPWLESCHHLSELTITSCDKFFDVKARLPTVRELNIYLIEDFDSIENMSTWISRTFRNLGIVQFSFLDAAELQNSQFDWIQNVLLLPRLGEIRFRFTYPYGKPHHDFSATNLIRQYCSDKASLVFREGTQTYFTGSCFIKILPNQNYN